MDRKTLIAVVLSVIVITVGFMLQNALFPPATPPETAQGADRRQPGTQSDTPRTEPIERTEDETQTVETQQESLPQGAVAPVRADDISDQPQIYANDLIRAEFDPVGGTLVSYQLFDHLDEGEPVEMILRGSEEQRAFEMAFGGPEVSATDALFRYRDTTDPNTVEFYRNFYIVGQENRPSRSAKSTAFSPESISSSSRSSLRTASTSSFRSTSPGPPTRSPSGRRLALSSSP